MAQHDYLIDNQPGVAFRADLNAALAAIVSNNAGATEPATTYPYQWWADTTSGKLKLRNAANTGWIEVGSLSDPNLGLALKGAITSSGLTQSSGKLLGRASSGDGAVEEISVGSGLSLTGVVLSASGVPVGSIIYTSSKTPPSGFLRCNGQEVSQTTYAELYAVVGDTYNYTRNVYVNGKPHRQQYWENTTQNADITGWTTGTSLPGALYASQAIVTNSRVYLLGGYVSSAVSTVYTAPINPDGTLGAWTTGTSLPGALYASQAIVTNSRVYLLGGYVSSAVSTVYTAPINPDGTLGAWTTGTSLPGALSRPQAIVTNSLVYLLGGDNGGSVSTVYTAPINPDGTLGAWTTGTSLPVALSLSQAIVTNSRVYLLGGYVSSAVSTVYTAPINPDGTLGAWTTGTSLPGALSISQAIVTNSRVYLLGGYVSSAVSTVYTASFSGGLNDYLTPHKSYIAQNPSTGNFYLPNVGPEATYYGEDAIYAHIKY
ncbi:tail fiber protein [Sulfuritortus calidifontis]|uniref:tail fiber protein n=1 Tax=Sulfuritortus calidifontis TaxID=1914471 RepID=UPI000F842AED|nr:tail fiber protein [Sulfuritortus calidifontis]